MPQGKELPEKPHGSGDMNSGDVNEGEVPSKAQRARELFGHILAQGKPGFPPKLILDKDCS